MVQEYYEMVKQEDAYIAVEKNAAGSRPKELFEDILEEVEDRFEKDRTVLKVLTGRLAATRIHRLTSAC